MAAAWVQGLSGATESASPSWTFTTQNVTAGNTLVAWFYGEAQTFTLSSVADSENNTWVVVNSGNPVYTQASGPSRVFLAYAFNAVGASKPTVTPTFSGTFTACGCVLAEYSGINTFRGLSANNTADNASPVSASLASVVSGDLLIGLLHLVGTETVTAGSAGGNSCTARNSSGAGGTFAIYNEDSLAASTASTTATWSLSGTPAFGWSAGLAAFYLVSGPVVTTGPKQGQPVPVVLTDVNGNVYATGGTPSSRLGGGQAVPVVMTDPNGNVLSQSFSLAGVKLGEPTPIIVCDNNGNIYSESGTLTGIKTGQPTPVVVTDANGNTQLSNGATSGKAGQPTTVVVCDQNGNILTFSGTNPLLALT
jgi:hypothetical protein